MASLGELLDDCREVWWGLVRPNKDRVVRGVDCDEKARAVDARVLSTNIRDVTTMALLRAYEWCFRPLLRSTCCRLLLAIVVRMSKIFSKDCKCFETATDRQSRELVRASR